MEQTIRQRRFDSLSARRKQKEEQSNAVDESTNKTPSLHEASQSTDDNIAVTNSRSSSPSSMQEVNASTSVETLSDLSITTPYGTAVLVLDMENHHEAKAALLSAPPLQLVLPSMSEEKSTSTPKAVLKPSLSKPSDFSFDRYSKIIDSPTDEVIDLDDIEVFQISDGAGTPIEVATPITYIKPNRPSMVSIFNILNKDSDKDSKKPLPARPDVPARNPERTLLNKRFSTVSSGSGFMAGEATPFQIPDLPENALATISNASQSDLSAADQSQEPALKKQKSSMALLSKAIKYSHSRMTSRAQSTSPPLNDHQRPQSQHEAVPPVRGPKPATKLPPPPSTLPAPPPSNRVPLPQYRHKTSKSFSRPQTANPSTNPPPMPPGVTALPPCTESFTQRESPIVNKPSSSMGHTARKKSLSALRSHGDNILNSITRKTSMGKAKGRAVARDALATPPLPTEPYRPVLVTPAKTSIDLGAFPTPPTPQSMSGSVRMFSRPLRTNTMPLHGLGVTVN